MKILIVGGRGTIGKKVTERLSRKHEVLTAGRSSGDLKVDIADSKSIERMFASSGKIDALVNGAIHSFVRAAHQELPRGVRLNVVVPGLVEDSAEALEDLLPGYDPVPMDRVVNGYLRSVEGGMTGQIIRVFA